METISNEKDCHAARVARSNRFVRTEDPLRRERMAVMSPGPLEAEGTNFEQWQLQPGDCWVDYEQHNPDL